MQHIHRETTWIQSGALWGVVLGLLLLVPAQVFDYSRTPWASVQDGTRERGDMVGRSFSSNAVAGDGVVAPFALYQLATSTAVASPTPTVVSPAPTDTTSPPPTSPPAHPTNTVLSPTPANTRVPTATLGGEGTPATATPPATPTTLPTATSPSLTPTAGPGQPEASVPAPTGEPVTATSPAASATSTWPAIAIQEVATATAILESSTNPPTTYTVRVVAPSGSLLDRLTRNKPGIWGSKAFYVGLAVVYIVVFALFLTLVLRVTRD